MEEDVRKLRDALRKAQRVAVLTGAGVSAESGVPTFRGADGLWQNYQATDLATPQAFAKDPGLVWKFYNWRRQLIHGVTFNPAHSALAHMEQLIPAFTLITQNVDGLHLLAGSQKVLEIHGNLWKVRCTRCNRVYMDRTPDLGSQPVCSECGGLLRPHVVWFGESLDPDVLQRAVAACRSAQVMLVIGTSSLVQPAASLSLEAKGRGTLVAEINLEKTPHSHIMDIAMQGKAGDIVPKLVEDWE